MDPLVQPVATNSDFGTEFLKTIENIMTTFKGVHTMCGLSNISFGLPGRPSLNAAFLAMIIGAGMTSAITNPLETEMVKAILGADALLGHDENCAAWITYYKKQSGSGKSSARRTRRPRSARSG